MSEMSEMSVQAGREAAVFSLKVPLVSKGKMDTILARSGELCVWAKVWADGGENTLHCHTNEDHAFVILQGQATFRLGLEEKPTVVDKHHGIMLPKGVYYWFESSSEENLVMLRVSAGNPDSGDDRLGADGRTLAGNSDANKFIPGVPVPGAFFGA